MVGASAVMRAVDSADYLAVARVALRVAKLAAEKVVRSAAMWVIALVANLVAYLVGPRAVQTAVTWAGYWAAEKAGGMVEMMVVDWAELKAVPLDFYLVAPKAVGKADL